MRNSRSAPILNDLAEPLTDVPPRIRSASADRSRLAAGPDGSSVLADSRSGYCCDAIYAPTVSDNGRNILTFVVPAPGTGAYTLTYSNAYLTSTGNSAGDLRLHRQSITVTGKVPGYRGGVVAPPVAKAPTGPRRPRPE
jgi:hypothetical protein